MPVNRQLLRQARESPENLRFDEAVTLAQQLGFELVRRAGSHRIFRHPQAGSIREQFPHPLNLQEGEHGKAKAYQVRQMLLMAEALRLLPKEED